MARPDNRPAGWGEGYRRLGRQALAEVIETEMAVDRDLEGLEAEDAADRRNGYYRRSLLTELGDIELSVPRTRPRTRRYCPTEVARDRGPGRTASDHRARAALGHDRSDRDQGSSDVMVEQAEDLL